MDIKLTKFEKRLNAYDGGDTHDIENTYARLSGAERLIPVAKGAVEKLLVARAIWLAESFAFKFYMENGREIAPSAFTPEEGSSQFVNGMFGQTSALVHHDLVGEVHRFLSAKFQELSGEWDLLHREAYCGPIEHS